jgi:hypothetical protein
VWVKEAYTDCCTRHVKSGVAWFKVGTWKLKIFNDEVVYKRMISCTNALELSSIAEYLYKARCK